MGWSDEVWEAIAKGGQQRERHRGYAMTCRMGRRWDAEPSWAVGTEEGEASGPRLAASATQAQGWRIEPSVCGVEINIISRRHRTAVEFTGKNPGRFWPSSGLSQASSPRCSRPETVQTGSRRDQVADVTGGRDQARTGLRRVLEGRVMG